MREIVKLLKEFEKDVGIEIILAVESGSRAWGFAGKDADYDIRFVFKRDIKEYLSLNKPRDCYEWTNGLFDFQGLDIFKFFGLLASSNMNMIDWLQQQKDMVYINKMSYKRELLKAIRQHFSRNIYIAHNYGLCRKNYEKYFTKKSKVEPTAKRYVYCLRALFSAEYCMLYNDIAPLKFSNLVNALLLNRDELSKLKLLINVKKQGGKVQYKSKFWSNFIKDKLNNYSNNYGHGNTEELVRVLNEKLWYEFWVDGYPELE